MPPERDHRSTSEPEPAGGAAASSSGAGKRTLTERLPAAPPADGAGEAALGQPVTAGSTALKSPAAIHQLFGARRGSAALLATQTQEEAEDQRIFDSQARLENTDVEIPALEGALLATRKRALQERLISQASCDAALALSRAMAKLRPAIAANARPDTVAQQQAASHAQLLYVALQRETAEEHNYDLVPSPRPSATVTSQNRYTGEARTSVMGTTQSFGGPLEKLPGLIRAAQWEEALRGYQELLEGLDRWIADRLRSKGPADKADGDAHEHFSQLRAGLEQIADKHATKLPAVFHPDAETVAKEKAAGRPVADAVPVSLYFWKDAATGKYHLRDLTTPSRPHEQALDGPPTAARLATFFEEVARYPRGTVRARLSSGETAIAATSGKTKWYEWAAYAGLALAGVGLALVTAGASIPATVCFAAGAIAGGVSAGGHLVDSVRLGTATTATVVVDASQIVTSFTSLGAMSIAVKAGGVATALSQSRWFVPLGTVAAGADVVQLVALTDSTFAELSTIQTGPGTPEDKQRAMSVLVTQLVVATGLAALSVQGARNLRTTARLPLEVVEADGAKILRVAGDGGATFEDPPALPSNRSQAHESRGAHAVPGAKFSGLATQETPNAKITTKQAVERAHDAVTILDGTKQEFLSIDSGGNIWISVGGEHCLIDITVGEAMADAAQHTYTHGNKHARIKISEHARPDDVTRAVAHELAEIRGLMRDATLKLTDTPSLTKGSAADKMQHHDLGRQAELEILLYELESQPARRAEILDEIERLVAHLGLEKSTIAADPRARKMLGDSIIKGVDRMNGKKRLRVARSAIRVPESRIERGSWEFNVVVDLPGRSDVLLAQGHAQLDSSGHPLEGPNFSIDKTRVIDGSEYRIDIEGIDSLTDFALDEATKAFTKDFGHPPKELPGSLANDNKAIFQKEYATQIAEGVTTEAAKQHAAAKTPFVVARVKKGYNVVEVDTSKEMVDIVLGHPPRIHAVPARIEIIARKP